MWLCNFVGMIRKHLLSTVVQKRFADVTSALRCRSDPELLIVSHTPSLLLTNTNSCYLVALLTSTMKVGVFLECAT